MDVSALAWAHHRFPHRDLAAIWNAQRRRPMRRAEFTWYGLEGGKSTTHINKSGIVDIAITLLEAKYDHMAKDDLHRLMGAMTGNIRKVYCRDTYPPLKRIYPSMYASQEVLWSARIEPDRMPLDYLRRSTEYDQAKGLIEAFRLRLDTLKEAYSGDIGGKQYPETRMNPSMPLPPADAGPLGKSLRKLFANVGMATSSQTWQ